MNRYGLMLLSCVMSINAWAFNWPSLWQTADQRAYALMQSNHFDAAETLFSSEAWAAAAAYRAKHFAQAAKLYHAVSLDHPTADAYYNEGNALAQATQLKKAIAAYDRALALDPNHNDALHNKRIVQALLKQATSHTNEDPKPKNNQPGNKSQDAHPSKSNSTSNQKPVASQTKPTPSSDPQNNDKSAPKSQKESSKSSQSSQEQTFTTKPKPTQKEREKQQENEQWLQLIPDDPGGLMREKFRRDYLRQQNGWY